MVPLKSAMKKARVKEDEPTAASGAENATSEADENGAPATKSVTTTNGTAAAATTKKEKKGIRWADEGGGMLREVQIIEVAKIKRSTADYSNTREMSKRERLAEKETHLAKTEDAMQRNTEWRTYVLRYRMRVFMFIVFCATSS